MKVLKNQLLNIFLVFIALLFLYPFIYMVLTSFTKTYSLGKLSINLSQMNLDNYVTIFKNYNFFTYFKNSTVVVIIACFVNAIISVMAAYGFSKKKFPFRDIIFYIYIATMMMPGQVKLVPMFIIMKAFGLLDNNIGLAIPVINAFGVFLVKQFMDALPNELLESAKMDGCSEWKVFTKIVVPLSKPVIISLTIFTFITVWNDFTWPLIMTSDSNKYTLTLALSTLQGNYVSNYGLVMAGATLNFLPPFIFYIILRRQFVQGITFTGSKE